MHSQGRGARRLLLESFHVAVAAADPAHILPPHLPPPPRGRTLVVGGGKAAASMAAAVEAHWPADAPLSGLVVTRYQHSLPTRRIEVVEASHPLPDGRGEAAALRMLDMVSQLGPDDLLLALISGGGSSLLAAPVEGVTLKELRQVTKALLHAGATIHDINTVRKHLTRLSGGRLAQAAHGARGLALIISDVVGDDPATIASGPCAPDPTCCADALERLQRFQIPLPAGIKHHLQACAAGQLLDTPNPGDPCFARMENRVIATAQASLQAAARYFERQGIPALVLSDSVSGDAQTVARQHAALVHALSNAETSGLDIRRRNHRHATAATWPGRPEYRIFAGTDTGIGKHPRLGDCMRYRRHRWQRGQCGRGDQSRHADACTGAGFERS